MINKDLYANFLLSRMPRAKPASGRKEIVCQCRYCDDKHAHMYLNIPNGSDTPLMFYCQRCNTRGFVTPEKLMEWNVYDDNIAQEIIEHNKKISKTSSKYSNREVYILFNNYINKDKLSSKKLEYLNNRLGVNLTYDDCMNLKIVLNLHDLLNSNKHITTLTRHESIVNELDINFLGFISLDNAFVALRRLVEEGKVYKSIDKRYVNYSIFNKFENIERFYTIPTVVNLAQPDRVKLHVAEGPMDILSIYLNLRNREPGLYTSVSGSNYFNLIKHFMLSMKLSYIEVHIYPDNDKQGSDNNMKYISDQLSKIYIPTYIHRNVAKGEKDMGVSPDRIKEVIYQL